MAELTKFEQWWLNAWPHRWHIRRHVPRFLKACPEPFRGQVLEVGAGAGWTSQRILETFPQVELTATDIDVHVNEQFRQLQTVYGQRLKFRQADVLQLPFDRNSFDVVLAVYVMHHLDDATLGLQQLLRVLRPGGLLGILDGHQKYSEGLASWLPRRSQAINRTMLEEILRAEDCQLRVGEGERRYMIWAQKAYPITPPPAA